MYIDPLSGSTMFREFIGTVPQGQSVLRLSERIRMCSDTKRENAAAVTHQKKSRTEINEKPRPPPSHMWCDQESRGLWW